jgi:hypothetical protein
MLKERTQIVAQRSPEARSQKKTRVGAKVAARRDAVTKQQTEQDNSALCAALGRGIDIAGISRA